MIGYLIISWLMVPFNYVKKQKKRNIKGRDVQSIKPFIDSVTNKAKVIRKRYFAF